MNYVWVAAGILFGIAFVFVPFFQRRISEAVQVILGRLSELVHLLHHGARGVWPLALIAAAYLLADRYLTKLLP